MTDDQLNTLMAQFARGVFDPTAPLPDLWPAGMLGVFLIFVTQFGAAVPLGVIVASKAGISPLMTAGLYFASDLVLAVTAEPMLALMRWLGQRVAFIGRVGDRLAHLSGAAGLQEGRVRGPLGLIALSFSISPQVGRAAGAAAGHGFFVGWALAIIGDMFYFGVIMASTLWIVSVFGDDRRIIGVFVLGTWVLPMLIRRLRQRSTRTVPRRTPTPRIAMATTTSLAASSAPPAPRRRATHTGRRRPSRGVQR